MNNLNLSNIPLFKSRKFWVAAIGLVLDIAIALIPDFEPIRMELMVLATTLVGLVIGGFAAEDVVIAFKTGERNPKYTETPPA